MIIRQHYPDDPNPADFKCPHCGKEWDDDEPDDYQSGRYFVACHAFPKFEHSPPIGCDKEFFVVRRVRVKCTYSAEPWPATIKE